MPILYELINFFGLDQIAQAQTFPELLQSVSYTFMSCFLVLYVCRALFAWFAQISKIR